MNILYSRRMIEIKMTCENNLVDQEKKLFLFLDKS